MTGISFVSIVIALAMLGIVAYFFMPTLRTAKPKRPEQWEKAAIMRQILAMSERDTGLPMIAPSARSRARASGSKTISRAAAKAPPPARLKT
jgi:type II secretory pathway pseudopilin PulG